MNVILLVTYVLGSRLTRTYLLFQSGMFQIWGNLVARFWCHSCKPLKSTWCLVETLFDFWEQFCFFLVKCQSESFTWIHLPFFSLTSYIRYINKLHRSVWLFLSVNCLFYLFNEFYENYIIFRWDGKAKLLGLFNSYTMSFAQWNGEHLTKAFWIRLVSICWGGTLLWTITFIQTDQLPSVYKALWSAETCLCHCVDR